MSLDSVAAQREWGVRVERGFGKEVTMRFERASDAELVRACIRGEAAAWEALITRYERLIYSISRAQHLTADEADEVFQQVCFLLLTHLETLKDHSRLSAWTLSSVCIKWIRVSSSPASRRQAAHSSRCASTRARSASETSPQTHAIKRP